MKTILREDESGVSEVIGTILILAMTVVLFSVIIIWVSSIPTPVAQSRLDVRPDMVPIYNGLGVEIGVNITIVHLGGEALQPVPTIIYVVSQRGGSAPQTDVVILHLYNGLLATPSGLLDGRDSVWDIGERWGYKNFLLRSSDSVSVTIVDIQKSIIVWTGQLNAPAGTRPPVFVDKWTDDMKGTDAIDPIQDSLGFFLYAKVADPDGDMNPNSVYATLTMWYGIDPTCSSPQKMHDDGVGPDRVPGDDVYTLGGIICMSPPYPPLTWDGAIILLNATDMRGHQTTTRLVLHVVQMTSGGGGTGGRIPSELWQYIGYVQIRTGEVWVSNLGQPYSTTTTFQPYRVTRAQLNNNGGALFHFKMANHGNTTIFIDGWTVAFYTSSQSAGGFSQYIVKPVDPNKPANAGGIGAYPGIATNVNDFQYAQVFDINVANQEVGGAPTIVLVATNHPFNTDWGRNWGTDSMFINILISGMAGPANYTYQQLVGNGPNPRNCLGLGPSYNPINHLNDAIVACRSSWYAQVIPFIGMVIY